MNRCGSELAFTIHKLIDIPPFQCLSKATAIISVQHSKSPITVSKSCATVTCAIPLI